MVVRILAAVAELYLFGPENLTLTYQPRKGQAPPPLRYLIPFIVALAGGCYIVDPVQFIADPQHYIMYTLASCDIRSVFSVALYATASKRTTVWLSPSIHRFSKPRSREVPPPAVGNEQNEDELIDLRSDGEEEEEEELQVVQPN